MNECNIVIITLKTPRRALLAEHIKDAAMLLILRVRLVQDIQLLWMLFMSSKPRLKSQSYHFSSLLDKFIVKRLLFNVVAVFLLSI